MRHASAGCDQSTHARVVGTAPFRPLAGASCALDVPELEQRFGERDPRVGILGVGRHRISVRPQAVFPSSQAPIGVAEFEQGFHVAGRLLHAGLEALDVSRRVEFAAARVSLLGICGGW